MIENKIKLCKKVHETAVEKGFWNNKRNHQELFMLIITELAEAVEAHRENKGAKRKRFESSVEEVIDSGYQINTKMFIQYFEEDVRGTVEEELADTWIRCADYLYYRYRDNIIFDEFNISWKDNFGENCLMICKDIVNGDIKGTMAMIESLCKHMNIDLEWFIINKIKYNKTRDKLHNKEY